MNNTLDLEDRLRELAAAVPPPATPLEQDLERGRSRLRRTRLLVTGGAAAGVAAIALGVGLTNAALDARDSSPTGPATQGVEPATPRPKADVDDRTGAELLQQYRNVLAEHIDPSGTHLQRKPGNLQSGGGLGTKLGWTLPGQDGLGLVQIFAGKGWDGFVGASCGSGAECSETTVDGVTAQIVKWDGTTSVVVERADGTVAISINALFGNNSLVPVEGMDIPIADLVRAAADERITQPTPEQIRNAGTSMGFPDYDDLGTLEEGQSEAPVPPAG
jgi:hypothetical protein